MDAPPFNGSDTRELGRATGPEPWKCLECPAAGKGYISRSKHWYETGQGHHIVYASHPRAKRAPRATAEHDPAVECLTADGEGRR
jgi:hypothetical protein